MVLLSLTVEQTVPSGLFIIMYVKPLRGNSIYPFYTPHIKNVNHSHPDTLVEVPI